MKTLIKICGIKEAEIAYATAKAGADYIGLVFAQQSPRLVTAAYAKEIAHATRAGGAEPVGVFTEQEAALIESICTETDIRIAQLHGNTAHQQGKKLSAMITCMYAFSVLANSGVAPIDEQIIKNLSPAKDKLLFDAVKPGGGKIFNWKNFYNQYPFTWFLAGGLQIDNVEEAIQKLKPSGVDVSTGVENQPGKKDLQLIKNFIEKVKYADTLTS